MVIVPGRATPVSRAQSHMNRLWPLRSLGPRGSRRHTGTGAPVRAGPAGRPRLPLRRGRAPGSLTPEARVDRDGETQAGQDGRRGGQDGSGAGDGRRTARLRSSRASPGSARAPCRAGWASPSAPPARSRSLAPCRWTATSSPTACCTAVPPACWPRPWARWARPCTAGPGGSRSGSRSAPRTTARWPAAWSPASPPGVHGGRTTATYEIAISDDRGRRVCSARLTCLLRDQVPAGGHNPGDISARAGE